MRRMRNMVSEKTFYRLLAVIMCLVILAGILVPSFAAFAASDDDSSSTNDELRYVNQENGNKVTITDDADLLTDGEEKELEGIMIKLSEYGHVGFYTTMSGSSDITDTAERYYLSKLGSKEESGTVFVIDMNIRELYIITAGYKNMGMRSVINSSRASTIADNVYTYATDKKYYKCAYEVFNEELTLMEGGRIAQPMKLTSNILLALVIGFIVAFLLVRAFSAKVPPTENELLAAIQTRQNLNGYQKSFTHTTRTYSPRSSGSSGGGGGGRGGGGGGGFSGGGHSF